MNNNQNKPLRLVRVFIGGVKPGSYALGANPGYDSNVIDMTKELSGEVRIRRQNGSEAHVYKYDELIYEPAEKYDKDPNVVPWAKSIDHPTNLD